MGKLPRRNTTKIYAFAYKNVFSSFHLPFIIYIQFSAFVSDCLFIVFNNHDYNMNAEKVLVTSTGLFAGVALGISISGVPTIAISQRPKDTWQKLYDTGKNTVVPILLTTAIAGGMAYSRTKNPRILAATIIGAFPLPFTVLGMGSNIKQLQSSNNADPRVHELTNTWAKLHWVRTIAGLTSFGLVVFTVL